MTDIKTALLARMEATLPELLTRNALLDGVLGGPGDELAVADIEIEIWGLGGDGAEAGTAAVTAGSPVVTLTGALPMTSRFIVGDEFYLAGSTAGNAGRYQVQAVTSDTVVTLTTNVPATESGIAFGRSTNRLARACLGLDIFAGGYEPTSTLRNVTLPSASTTHQLRGSRKGMTTELSTLTNTTAQLYDPTVPLVTVGTINAGGVRNNSVRWSRDLTNAAWTQTGNPSTLAQNAVGLDGTANSATTLTDADAAAFCGRQQSVTVPVDSNTHAMAFWIGKDTNQTRFPLIQTQIAGGTAVTRGVWLNTQTGAMVGANIVGTGTARVVDGGLWWIVEITLTNNSTALNTTLTYQIFEARGTVIGTDNVAATGSCVVGQVQVELNSPFYSSPIFTTTAAVTAPAERVPLSAPYVLPPGVTTATGQPIAVSNSLLGKNGRYAIYAQPSAAVLVLARKTRHGNLWFPYAPNAIELQFREDREARRVSFRLNNTSTTSSQTVTCSLGVTGGVSAVGVPAGAAYSVALANGVASWSWTVPAGQSWSGWVQVSAIHPDDEFYLTVAQSGGGSALGAVRLGYTGLFPMTASGVPAVGLAPTWKWGGLIKTQFPTPNEETTAVVSQGVWPGWFAGITDVNAYENDTYTMASPSDFFVLELDHRNTLNYSESAIRTLAAEHLAPVDADIILGFV